jgi:hypothetical protein
MRCNRGRKGKTSMVKLPLLVLSVIGLASCARADGLFSVPTAQNPDKSQIQFSLEQDASGTSFRSPDTLRLATVQYGLTKRLAVGFDLRLSGKTKIEPNIALALTRPKAPVALNIGFQNVGVRSFGEQPYLVASRDFRAFSLHSGLTHDSNGTHGMIGAEKHFGKRFEILGDYIGGRGNFATIGAQFTLAKDVGLEAGYMIANSRSDTNGLYLSLERDFH